MENMNEISEYNQNNNLLPKDFKWKIYLELNSDVKISYKDDAINHYINYGIKENRPYKYELPDDFNWKSYLFLNTDLSKNINENEAISHYMKFGIKENRKYKENGKIPWDFNWKKYLSYNPDVAKFYPSKKDAEKHYCEYGIFEKRTYKRENFIYDLIIKKKINYHDNLFDICCNIIKNKNILNENIENFDYSYKFNNTNLNFDLNEIFIKKNYLECSKYSNIDTVISSEVNMKKTILNYEDSTFFDIYESFILILDLPETFSGGSKFFINEIIEKYNKFENFLVIYTENNLNKFNINNKYFFNNNHDDISALILIKNIKNKIRKIFINHTYGFSKYFIQGLFNLKINISTITHDHYLFNEKTQLMHYEINEKLYNSITKYNLNLFNNIITQNKYNLYLFKNYKSLKNIIICDLPDFKYSNEIIPTDNDNIVVGIIGAISDIKGSYLIDFLITYFKDSYVKLIIFGKISNINYENCYHYNDINELNYLLKIHKPNILLETSLWPETYSYTLTLSMLTDLPILVLKKPFNSVIKNRLKKYKKVHYFKTFYELLKLIDKEKQNYFRTIQPIIYFNKFWDNFFLNVNKNNYNYYIENKKYNLKDTINKNIILITSKIYVSDINFSYSEKRSVYDSTTRYKQTLNTISSIKKFIPDYFIVLIDNSEFTNEEVKNLSSAVDCFINITDNEKLNYYTNICKYKYLADLYHQINSYYYLLKYIDFSRIKQFFKISGRYYINETFNYRDYDNTLNIFKKNNNILDRDYYYTSFFKISKTFLPKYFSELIHIFENRGDYFDLDLEVIYGKTFLKDMTLIENLGITQIISCWNEISNI